MFFLCREIFKSFFKPQKPFERQKSDKYLSCISPQNKEKKYIQVHLKKIEYHVLKLIFFLLPISKSENFIYFRCITCKVKHFKIFCFNIDD